MRNQPVVTSTPNVSSAADIPNSPTLWAIPDLLPCHHLSAIVAPTGAGLTSFAVNLCAQLAPPSSDTSPSVLLIPGRESPYALRARLAAAGVDLARILILEHVRDDLVDDYRRDSSTRPFAASDHEQIAGILADHRSIQLVLIDNAEDLFIATNRPSRNRLLRDLAAFQALAQTREIAITFLTAIPTLRQNPFSTGLLSALQHVCRSVHLLAPAPDDDTATPQSTSRSALLFPIKNTLLPDARTLQLDLAPGVHESRACDLTYHQYLRRLRAPRRPGPAPVSCNYAIEVLTTILPPGRSLPVGELRDPKPGTIHYLIQQAGLSFATVVRAKEQLGITSSRGRSHWSWHNPATPNPIPAPQTPPARTPETCNSSRNSATPASPAMPATPATPLPAPANPVQTRPPTPSRHPAPPTAPIHEVTHDLQREAPLAIR